MLKSVLNSNGLLIRKLTLFFSVITPDFATKVVLVGCEKYFNTVLFVLTYRKCIRMNLELHECGFA